MQPLRFAHGGAELPVRLLLFFFATLFSIEAAVIHAQDSSASDQLATVFAAWQKRQDRAATFEIGYRDRKQVLKSFLDGWRAGETGEELVGITESIRMVASSQQLRVESKKRSSDSNRNDDVVVVFDGASCIQLHEPNERIRHHTAFITTLQKSSIVRLVGYDPILLHFRPLEQMFASFSTELATIDAEPTEIGDYKCLILQVPYGTAGTKRYFVANDGEHFPILRIQSVNAKGAIERQIDIKYRKTEDFGFVPVTWRIARLDRNTHAISSTVSTAFECTIGRDVAAGSFILNLPVGTHVTDMTNTANIKDYIIQPTP